MIILIQPVPAGTDGLGDESAMNGQATTAITSATFLPTAPRNYAGAGEWAQHAHDAQHTSYTDQVVATSWRWKWVWNGPDSSGGISSGKFKLPRNSQPVTGDDRVYIAAGSNGVYALKASDGTVAWSRQPGGSINSTPAYDATTRAVFVVSSNGALYKLDAVSGDTLSYFKTRSSSTLPLPPAIVADRVFFSMGNRVYAVNKNTMTQIWSYDAGALVHTPPAYSPSRNRVIVVSNDLYVHAINNTNGGRAWRVKPTVRNGGEPGENDATLAEAKFGWPVIAEVHGYVLVKYRLNWATLWTWSPWPGDNATMRSNLQSRPDEQALFVLDLEDGANPFIANVGHGGFGDGGYLPMGPQPVIKPLPNGQEVAYVVMRGSPCIQDPCNGQWDAHLGEMVLDNNTVSGYQAGYVRFIRNTFFPTDEQGYLSMAGDYLFAAHWEAGIAHQIADRSATKGTNSNPITTLDLPHIVTSQDSNPCGGFSASHYCGQGLINTRMWPSGFYIYWQQGTVYDQYWSGYAAWVVSNNTIYFLSTDGAVVALEQGNPATALSSTPAMIHASSNSDASYAASRFSAEAVLEARSPSSSAKTVIPYPQAWLYAGQEMIVEGAIQYVFNNRRAVYLGFKNPHQGAFKVRIKKEDWDNFESPPEAVYLVGQRVRVHGLIEWYQGDPVIYVRDPSQIEAVDQPNAEGVSDENVCATSHHQCIFVRP